MDSATTQKLIYLAATFCLTLVSVIPANSIPSAYEILEGYDYPVGLLPKGIIAYDLNVSTGQFQLYLHGVSCSFRKVPYQVKYKPTIRGYISDERIFSLEGVSVKGVWMWMDIKEIVKDRDNLDFYVGSRSAGYPVDFFEDPPKCGCGRNCDHRLARNLEENPLLPLRRGIELMR